MNPIDLAEGACSVVVLAKFSFQQSPSRPSVGAHNKPMTEAAHRFKGASLLKRIDMVIPAGSHLWTGGAQCISRYLAA